MTKAELAEKLAREEGRSILDDPMGISEAMESHDVEGDWHEMEVLIREALATNKTVESVQTDDTRIETLNALTGGRPHALIFVDLGGEWDSRIIINMECGGGITNREQLEDFLEAALRYLREG